MTTANPDGTKQVQSYTAGVLASTVQQDTSGATVTSISYAYDGFNRQTSSTDSRTASSGNTTTTYVSDLSDMVSKVTDPGNRATSYTYDTLGRRTAVKLPDGTITTTAYDSYGRVTQVSGSQTYPVSYTYDYAGRKDSMTTSYGSQNAAATTTWSYDTQRGFMTRKQYPDGNGTDYTYSAAGRLKTRGWARGVTTTGNRGQRK